MNLLYNMVINLYSLIILSIIYIHSLKQEEKGSLQYRLYMMMVKVTGLLLVMDICGRFDGRPDTIFPIINQAGNFMLFLLNLVVPSLWLLYVYNELAGGGEKTRRFGFILLAVNCLNALAVAASIPNGWFYYIDTDNIYHRGAYFPFCYAGAIIMLAASYFLIIKNRKEFEKNHYSALAFFAVPPLLGMIMQVMVYGVSLMLNSVTVSLFIIFLKVQNQTIYTDYLTGISNRKKLDIHMKKKISTSSGSRTFAAIMLDLDDFKRINDSFGHDAGDNALRISAQLLKDCLRTTDFIARFGGDEFCIVLDVADKKALEEIMERIHERFREYNSSGELPYELAFSSGYTMYEFGSGMGVEEFQKQLDQLMYKNKQYQKSMPAVQ